MYGVQNVITKSTVDGWVQRFEARRTSTSDESQSSRPSKRNLHVMQQALTNSSINTKNASLGMAIMSKSRL